MPQGEVTALFYGKVSAAPHGEVTALFCGKVSATLQGEVTALFYGKVNDASWCDFAVFVTAEVARQRDAI